MRTLNLGIVAHVDAGKTSLTERILFEVGVLDHPGSVDDGTTLTDSLELERRRGITIRSAVVSFRVGELTVNLVDTPGHSDFIAEVERALSVLDGAVLVVSAVEGVQAQTLVLMRTLQRLGLPVLIFVNKVDRAGADPDRVVADIARRLSGDILSLSTVTDAGTPTASVGTTTIDADGGLRGGGLGARLTELVADHDDRVLEAWTRNATPAASELRARFGELSRRGIVHGVLAGSARTGVGVGGLLDQLGELLPGVERDADAELDAVVFKIDRDESGERLVFMDVRAGTLRVRERVAFRRPAHGPERQAQGPERPGQRPVRQAQGPQGATKVTGIRVFTDGGQIETDAAPAGSIALVRGLDGAAIGDVLGWHPTSVHDGAEFARPTLQAVVRSDAASDRAAVHSALVDLAEQDPLIGLRHDDRRGETTVMLYGEVQKEIIQSMLLERYGLEVEFHESSVICIERVAGIGEAVEVMGAEGNPFLATIGLRVEPSPPCAGVRFELGIELGSMPLAFFTATEATVRATLEQGLHGWEVPDCIVTMTRSGYAPRQSHAHQKFDKSMSSTGADFRGLTPLVLANALAAAGTRVCEPFQRFEIDVPPDSVGPVLVTLNRQEAIPMSTEEGRMSAVITGRVPARRLDELQAALPRMTRGEGVLRSDPDGYEPVRGVAPPSRGRLGADPRDREGYLLALQRGVARL